MATTSAAKTTSEGRNATVSGSDLESDVRQLRADVAQLANHLREIGGQSGSAARKAARRQAEHLREQGEAALASVQGGARDLERELARTIRERPMTALALAAGTGFLLALMTRR